jgi:hypothetical protein
VGGLTTPLPYDILVLSTKREPQMRYEASVIVHYVQTIGVDDIDNQDDLIMEVEDVLRQNRFSGGSDMEYDGSDDDWKINVLCDEGHLLVSEISVEEVDDYTSCPICDLAAMTPVDRWLAQMKGQK